MKYLDPRYWLTRMTTRRCHRCEDPSFHTHHITWVGRLRYGLER